jgi:ATP adenylyltransferase
VSGAPGRPAVREDLVDGCLSCELLAGRRSAPGGVLYENATWLVLHQISPARFPGYLFIILKRHGEHLADLTPEEAAGLGPTIQLTSEALRRALNPPPEKVYVGSFGEGVKHVHFHVIPRTPEVPAGIMPIFTHLELRRLLSESGMPRWATADGDAEALVAAIEEQTRGRFRQLLLRALPRRPWAGTDEAAAALAARVHQAFWELTGGGATPGSAPPPPPTGGAAHEAGPAAGGT